jgi:N12 class adenine-specific DNA methylase
MFVADKNKTMKKNILSLLFVSFALVAFGQKVKQNDVPQVVKDALYKMYPNAKVTEWEKEDGNYEAEFENNDVETSVVITPAGAHVMTEVEIAITELPQAAQDYVKNNYTGKKITEACKMTTASGAVSYEAEVDGKDLLFDSGGNYTGTENEDEEKDDDDK